MLTDASQHEAGDFGRAAKADGVLAGDSFVHVEERALGAEEAAVETAGVAAGDEDRTDERQANLAAVIVAGEHEVNSPLAGFVQQVG